MPRAAASPVAYAVCGPSSAKKGRSSANGADPSDANDL